MSKKKLYKSTDDKAIAGVCGGIAEYFDIDSLIVRLVFVLLTLAYAAGAVVYLVLALAMPKRQMSAAYAYSGAPGEAYAYGGFEPANDAARRFSAQVNGEETNSAYVSPQTAFSGMSEMAEAAGQEAEEVPVILQAQAAFEEPQQASRADEFDEEPCDSDDLDPAPVIHEIHEAPSAAYGGAEGPQAGAYAHGQQGSRDAGRYDKFAAYSTIENRPARPAAERTAARSGRSKGRSAGIALVIAGAVIVLKVLVPEIKMMLLFGIGMVAAGLFLIFKGNE